MDDEQANALRRAVAAYRQANSRVKTAADNLASAVKAAHAAGVKKSDILRAIDHEWSRSWLDRLLAPANPHDRMLEDMASYVVPKERVIPMDALDAMLEDIGTGGLVDT